MKKFTKFISLLLLGLVLVFAGCKEDSDDSDEGSKQAKPTEAGVTALSNLKALDGVSGVYTLEYEGAYCLDKMLETGAATEEALLTALSEQIASDWKCTKTLSDKASISFNLAGDYGCASIVADNAAKAGGKIYGRNFDWDDVSILLIHTKPYPSGYESYSTSCLEFIGLDRDWEPQIIHSTML